MTTDEIETSAIKGVINPSQQDTLILHQILATLAVADAVNALTKAFESVTQEGTTRLDVTVSGTVETV